MIDQQTISKVAAEYNIPPAILSALEQQMGGGGLAFGLSDAHLSAAGFNRSEVSGNDYVQLEIAARGLAQAFQQQQSWEAALSQYATGDPQAYQSPTSSVGGFVYGTLGQASAIPTLGMDGFVPSDPSVFSAGAASFTQSMTEAHSAGGVVTDHRLQSWHSASTAATRAAYDIPAQPIIGSKAPFDARFDQVNQPFGPTDLAMEPSYGGYAHFHEGTDYNVTGNAPLRAITGGKIRIQAGTWGGGNAVTVVAPDGSTYLYGHVSTFNVKDGDTVQPGQQIALSGNTGNSTGEHLHFEVHNPSGQLVDGDPVVQAAITGATTHPAAVGNPHPELVVSGQKQGDVLKAIDTVAAKLGVDPKLARAVAIQESGGDPNAVGDQGTSFGLYQLHQGGELGSHDQAWASNPTNNAMTALTEVARVAAANPGMSPGEIAALAQRPADPQGYAASVNAILQDGNLGPAPAPSAPQAQAAQQAVVEKAAKTVDPAKIGEFAAQIKGQGIDIDHFIEHFGFASAMRRKLAELPTTVSDFARYSGMTVQQIAEAIRAEPHPTYPDVTIGAFSDAYSAAFMHSVAHLNATPNASEAARFAAGGFKHTDIRDYYQGIARNVAHKAGQGAVHPHQQPQPKPADSPQQAGQQASQAVADIGKIGGAFR